MDAYDMEAIDPTEDYDFIDELYPFGDDIFKKPAPEPREV